VAEFRARRADDSYPPIVINSVDLTTLVRSFEAGDLDAVVEYLARGIERLARAGADFAVLSANTPHIVFDRVLARSPLPMISIVEAACDAARDRGFKRVGLFGTRFTMQGRFYQDVFSKRDIAVLAPEPADQERIHDIYMGELVRGVFLPASRDRLLEIAARLRERQRVEAIILGGTELPLILRDDAGAAVPFLDTTMIHVRSIVTEMLEP
jgi:aspartate racemase